MPNVLRGTLFACTLGLLLSGCGAVQLPTTQLNKDQGGLLFNGHVKPPNCPTRLSPSAGEHVIGPADRAPAVRPVRFGHVSPRSHSHRNGSC